MEWDLNVQPPTQQAAQGKHQQKTEQYVMPNGGNNETDEVNLLGKLSTCEALGYERGCHQVCDEMGANLSPYFECKSGECDQRCICIIDDGDILTDIEVDSDPPCKCADLTL